MQKKYIGLPFDNKWNDKADSEESIALSSSEIEVWINNIDLQMASNIWIRYRHFNSRFKSMQNWMRKTFFFTNATSQQIARIESLVNDTVFISTSPTLMDVLNNPSLRKMVDGIEDTMSSLQSYNGKEPTLERILKQQVEELKEVSGYEYKIS